ncbi:MAG: DUF6599 family protein [Candidatus Aminicenantaceae bacterium]
MKKVAWIVFFLFFLGGLSLMGKNSKDKKITLGGLLPQEIQGWKAEEKDEIYDPQTIFDYINGAGEIYRSYNFKLLLARRFIKEGQPNIVADLFDMASSMDAFGVFTHDLEGEDAGIGQGSTYKGGLLSFWKDHFFVSLYVEEETEDTKNALLALGREVSSSIKKEGEKPDIVSLLPLEDLSEKDVHYFHNHLILNYHYYVSDENILFLDQKTEAALGIYEAKDDKHYLLLVRYPEIKKASHAYESFTKIYMPEAGKSGIVQTEDLKWTAARVKKNILIIVFSASSDSYAKDILEKVSKKISQI